MRVCAGVCGVAAMVGPWKESHRDQLLGDGTRGNRRTGDRRHNGEP